MHFSRHTSAWRLTAVATIAGRLTLTAAVSAALLTSGWMVTTAQAAVISPARAGVIEGRFVQHSRELGGSLKARPQITLPIPTTTGGAELPHEVPVEGGRIKDWQAMLVSAAGATALLFFVGKVRKK